MNDCLFCKIINGEIQCEKIYENDAVCAFLDIHPVGIGHTLIVPKEHSENLYDTRDEVLRQIAVAIKKIGVAIKKSAGANGINVIMNNESAAGQVVFHAHIHIIPRFFKDGFTHWRGTLNYGENEMNAIGKKIRAEIKQD